MQLTSTDTLARIGAFSIYTAWLAAFAMAGPLQGADFVRQFLLAHTLGLVVLTQARVFQFNHAALLVGVMLSALDTALFPFSGAFAPALMSMLGLTSAPLAMRSLIALKALPRPVVGAAAGLTLGHLLLLMIINLLPAASPLGPIALAVLLLFLLTVPALHPANTVGPVPGLARLLMIIFFFQVVSGLMYVGLFPAFHDVGLLADSHAVMLFYALGPLVCRPYGALA